MGAGSVCWKQSLPSEFLSPSAQWGLSIPVPEPPWALEQEGAAHAHFAQRAGAVLSPHNNCVGAASPFGCGLTLLVSMDVTCLANQRPRGAAHFPMANIAQD